MLQCKHTCLANSHLHRVRHAVPGSPVTALALPSSVAHLVQLGQQDLSEVKDGEADSYRDGPFDPVHTKTFIESADHPFLCDNLPHGAQDGAVRVTRHSSSLHSAPYHIQRVGRRLADEAGAGSKPQALVRVWLPAPAVICVGEEGGGDACGFEIFVLVLVVGRFLNPESQIHSHTCMHFLQCLVREEAETSIRHHTQNSGSEAPVQRLQALFSVYSHKHMQDVTVPNRGQNEKRSSVSKTPQS